LAACAIVATGVLAYCIWRRVESGLAAGKPK